MLIMRKILARLPEGILEEILCEVKRTIYICLNYHFCSIAKVEQ